MAAGRAGAPLCARAAKREARGRARAAPRRAAARARPTNEAVRISTDQSRRLQYWRAARGRRAAARKRAAR